MSGLDLLKYRCTYNEHGVGNLVLANASSQDDHACFLRLARQLVESTDIMHYVQYESWRAERVEVDHVSNGTIR